MASNELIVCKGKRKVAYLTADERDDWQLIYRHDIIESDRISVRLPVGESAYHGVNVAAYFRNLLPCKDFRHKAAEQIGLSRDNDFGLLAEICHETFGALGIFPPALAETRAGDLRALDALDLRNIVGAMTIDPMLTRLEGYRHSLPGEHTKLAVRIVDEQMYLPLGRELSSHIVKPAYPDRRESLENEAFCLRLARAVGLPVVNASLKKGSVNYLLIERVDRVAADSDCNAIHTENFNQINFLQTENAFQREGGLSASECIEILRHYSVQPVIDIKHFLNWTIFNFLIGNGQAMAKDLAMIHSPKGPRLAPFFGLSSTHIYSNLSNRLAMSVGRDDRPDWLVPARWREFALNAGISAAIRF